MGGHFARADLVADLTAEGAAAASPDGMVARLPDSVREQPQWLSAQLMGLRDDVAGRGRGPQDSRLGHPARG
jgi:hypothetical protein